MSVDTRKLAEEIVGSLFVNGSGEHADRLVLTVDGPTKRDLGGWSCAAAVDVVEKALRVLNETSRGIPDEVRKGGGR